MSDKHYNAHRANKKPVQVMLTEDEYKLLNDVKEITGIKTIKRLIMTLLNEEKQRHGGKG